MSNVETSESTERRDAHQLRPGRLGAVAIAFFVISAAAPLTGMAGGAPFAMLLGNGAGVPFAYLLVTILMLVFAVGYVAMARHHTSAGAFYAYVARAMGDTPVAPPPGSPFWGTTRCRSVSTACLAPP